MPTSYTKKLKSGVKKFNAKAKKAGADLESTMERPKKYMKKYKPKL